MLSERDDVKRGDFVILRDGIRKRGAARETVSEEAVVKGVISER